MKYSDKFSKIILLSMILILCHLKTFGQIEIIETEREYYGTTDRQCFTRLQLQQMLTSPLFEIMSVLNKKYWSYLGPSDIDYLYTYFDFDMDYESIQWGFSGDAWLTVYQKHGRKNILIFHTRKDCFYGIMNEFSQHAEGITTMNSNYLSTVYRFGSDKVEFRDYSSWDENAERYKKGYIILSYNIKEIEDATADAKKKKDDLDRRYAESDSLYHHYFNKGNDFMHEELYEQAISQYEQAKDAYYFYGVSRLEDYGPGSEIEEIIDKCRFLMCKRKINKGDSLLNEQQFELALSVYYEVLECIDNRQVVIPKIMLAKDEIKKKKIESLMRDANQLELQKNLDAAFNNYNEVVRIDSSNIMAKQKLHEIRVAKEILRRRTTTIFSYKELMPMEYHYIIDNKIIKDVENVISASSNGKLAFSYVIFFDTTGVNKSHLLSKSISEKKLAMLFPSVSTYSLPPTYVAGYYVASEETIDVDMYWNTSRIKIISKHNGIKNSDPEKFSNKEFDAFKSKHFQYGSYLFEVKVKTVNNKTFSDITCIKYDSYSGVSPIILSALIPGTGTIKIGENKGEGWLTLVSCLSSACMGIIYERSSEKYYKQYLDANDPDEKKYYQDQSNGAHSAALIWASISAIFYLSDLGRVVAHVVKNQRETSEFRNDLKRSPVIVKKEIVTIEE
jgi:tetratricopeptide (TPR) repeat protein